MTEICRAYGCANEIFMGHPFCKRHWWKLPSALRHELRVPPDDWTTPTGSYHKALETAIETIQKIESTRGFVPAPPNIRLLRRAAHASFDRLWESGRMSRGRAYRWLARQLGIPEREAHMGVMTDPDLLRRVVEVCDELLGSVASWDFEPVEEEAS